MTEGVVVGLAADDRRGLSEVLKGGPDRVTESAMPGGWGRSGHKGAGTGRRRWKLQGVEGSWAVTSKEGTPGVQILHRNTKGIKFNGNMIVSGKLANGKEVLNDIRSNKNVGEAKRIGKSSVAGANHWEGSSIAHNNGGGERG
jgi:hypothetical protein